MNLICIRTNVLNRLHIKYSGVAALNTANQVRKLLRRFAPAIAELCHLVISPAMQVSEKFDFGPFENIAQANGHLKFTHRPAAVCHRNKDRFKMCLRGLCGSAGWC